MQKAIKHIKPLNRINPLKRIKRFLPIGGVFLKIRALALILAFSLFNVSPAFSVTLPSGGSFVSGSGTISSSGSSMNINQSSSKGIIDWNGFSIGQGASVYVNNGSGATLSRVTGPGISSIAGILKSTGSFYLVNPSGIVITSSGSVITGGDFIASTLNISDSDFLNNNFTFAGSAGSVTNYGSVTSGGNVVLAGTAVVNSGSVTSSRDTSLVSGTELVLIPQNGLSGVLVSPSSVSGDVTNSGVIKAASAYLSSSNGDVYALAGNNGGLIEATGASTINGQVWLTAPKGTVSVSSPIKSSGNVYIDGTQGTALTSSSSIYSNGGDIKIGVFPSLPESLSTAISSGSVIYNPLGTVETSGDTLTLGNAGITASSWLLDPADFTVDATNNGTIDTALASGSVTITTTSTSPTTSPSLTSGSYDSGTGDINIDAPVSWSTPNTLTLSAYDSINVNSTITASGGGGLVLDYNTGNLTQDLATDTGELYFPLTSSGFTGSIQFTGTSSGNPTGSLTTQEGTNTAVTYTLVNANNLSSVSGSGDYALATSITAPSSFTPIGESSAFTGIFNGLGNTINGLTIGSSSSAYSGTYTGLFGQVGSTGTVENVGVTNESIYGRSHTGGLVGYSNGTISDSYSTGTVSGTGNNVGGLVGNNNSGTVQYSYSTGTVTGANSVGGLVGYNSGTVSDSYSTGTVSGTNSVGGLVGWNSYGGISDSYSTGTVSGTGGDVGGLVGGNFGTISDSYSTGTVTGANSVGGLVGYDSLGTVEYSYSTGQVTGTSYTGGLVGYNSGGTYTADYWDTTNNSSLNPYGIGNAASPVTEVTGLTDSQMKQLSSFSAWGSSIIDNGSSYVNSSTNPWFIYNGYTYPLLTAFMTPLTVSADSVTASAYTAPAGVTYSPSGYNASDVLGTLSYITPDGSLPDSAGTYGLGGLYSIQQGYIISYGSETLTIKNTVAANYATVTELLAGFSDDFLPDLENGYVGYIYFSPPGFVYSGNVYSGNVYSGNAFKPMRMKNKHKRR